MKIWTKKLATHLTLTDYPTDKWPFEIVITGSRYELWLSYQVTQMPTPSLTVPENQVLENSTSNRSLSFDDLVNIPDPKWKLPININVTRTYPQAIDVVDAAKCGAHIATVPYKVLHQMVKHPLTDAGIERFLADWASVPSANQ